MAENFSKLRSAYCRKQACSGSPSAAIAEAFEWTLRICIVLAVYFAYQAVESSFPFKSPYIKYPEKEETLVPIAPTEPSLAQKVKYSVEKTLFSSPGAAKFESRLNEDITKLRTTFPDAPLGQGLKSVLSSGSKDNKSRHQEQAKE